MFISRENARTGFQGMKDMIEFLSKMRINMLFLVIDTYVDKDIQDIRESGLNIDTDTSISGLDSESRISGLDTESRISGLDNICGLYCIALIPTIIITSINQKISVEILKSFKHSMVCIIFMYDLKSVLTDNTNTDENMDINDSHIYQKYERMCKFSVENLFRGLEKGGKKSVIFGCTDWIRMVCI